MPGSALGAGSAVSDSGASNPGDYSLSGILHFLQGEWRRYEHDRNSWEIERAELRARIALLEGERRGVENVKTDLLRRIRMLEYALRQERMKALSNAPSAPSATRQGSETGSSPTDDTFTGVSSMLSAPVPESARSASSNGAAPLLGPRMPPGVKDAKGRAKTREYLQQCLQEISYLTNSATLNPIRERDGSVVASRPGTGASMRPRMTLHDDVPSNDGRLPADAAGPSRAEGVSRAAPRAEEVPRAGTPSEPEKLAAPFGVQQTSAVPPQGAGGETVASTPPAIAAAGNAASQAAETPADAAERHPSTPKSVSDVQLWSACGDIQAHFDTLRGLVFDSTDPGIFTVSDDCTIKYWDVRPLEQDRDASVPEPVHRFTLRGHTAAVTSLVYSKTHRHLFTGSVDGTVRVWKIAEHAQQAHEESVLLCSKEPVWGVALHASKGRTDALLSSISADGLVRVWQIETPGTSRLLHSWDFNGLQAADVDRTATGSLPVPTSVAACRSDPRLCAVSYSNAVVKLFALDDGHEVKRLATDQTYDGTSATQVNMVATHPTLPIVATAHEDGYIRMFDTQTGEQLMSIVAHKDGVTCIDIDPAGLTLVSGSQDCSVRFWDILEKNEAKQPPDGSGAAPAQLSCDAVCFQEIRAHQQKGNEGVLAAVYHPSAPFVATGGADGAVRLYG